jgi:amino acid transporter, AAT family
MTSIAVQGWSSLSPVFKPVDFISYYVELPVMLVMFIAWTLTRRFRRAQPMAVERPASSSPGEAPPSIQGSEWTRWFDVVDVATIDLKRDEYEDDQRDFEEDDVQERRLKGQMRWAWKIYHYIA